MPSLVKPSGQESLQVYLLTYGLPVVSSIEEISLASVSGSPRNRN